MSSCREGFPRGCFAIDGEAAALEDMSVDHGSFDIFVTKKFPWPAEPGGKVFLMNGFNLCKMFPQDGDETIGEHGHAVVAALAIVDNDAMVFEINIPSTSSGHRLDPQSQTFHQPKSTTIHDLNHEFMCACHVGNDGPGFIPGKHNGNTLALFGSDKVEGGFIQINFQEAAIEEDNGAQRLILGGGRYDTSGGEVRDEGLDFLCAHIFGMAFVVKEDAAANPGYVGFFGALGVMFDADGITHLVEELSCFWDQCVLFHFGEVRWRGWYLHGGLFVIGLGNG